MLQRRLNRIALLLAGLLTAVLLSGCGGPNLFSRLNSPFGYGICGLIILVLDILAIVDLLGSSRSTGDKLLWSLLIIIFPVGGLIIYYLFGR